MKRIGILTSGGDAPGMNAAIRAIVRTAIDKNFEPIGIKWGYDGLIDGDSEPLSRADVGGIIHRGGTILKTGRSKRFLSLFGQETAVKNLKNLEIEDLIIIGGDGTFRGGIDLSKLGINVYGIPSTIDNDMGFTDYTIGFDTAVNTVLEAISRLRDTGSAHERITIVEVMGRSCGDIGLYAGLTGGADYIVIPEIDTDENKLCDKIIQGINRNKGHCIIMNAEGSSHTSEQLVQLIEKGTGREAKIVVLAYLQRGGSPSARDRMIATMMGSHAVALIEGNVPNRGVGVRGNTVVDIPLKEAASIVREADLELLTMIDILSK